MRLDLTSITEELHLLHHQLSARHPEEISAAKSLAVQVVDPLTATAEEIWPVLWDKPLYANTKVSIGEKAIAKLRPLLGNSEIWKQMRKDSGPFAISKIAPGSGEASFEIRGAVAQQLKDHSIAKSRINCIVGGGQALAARASRSRYPFADLVQMDTRDAVKLLRSEFGAGWGDITVLHYMTDLGLVCKPDMHLCNTVRHLGFPIAEGRIPTTDEAIAITSFVRVMVQSFEIDVAGSKLRYLDKILMEVSKQGLIGERTPLAGLTRQDAGMEISRPNRWQRSHASSSKNRMAA